MTLTMVNVNSGTTARYERAECPDDIVEGMLISLAHKDGMLTNGWSVVPGDISSQKARFDCLLDGTPITHCWLCLSEIEAKNVWRDIVNARPPIMKVSEPPRSVPWLAVSMSIDSIKVVLTSPHRLFEAVGIEVGMAWTLMKMFATK
jgi:hypothetical protein